MKCWESSTALTAVWISPRIDAYWAFRSSIGIGVPNLFVTVLTFSLLNSLHYSTLRLSPRTTAAALLRSAKQKRHARTTVPAWRRPISLHYSEGTAEAPAAPEAAGVSRRGRLGRTHASRIFF